MKFAIYTAIFGNYDNLKEPIKQDINCDFILFSDKLYPGSNSLWKRRNIQFSEMMSPRANSKLPKLIPHKYLADYDYVLWVDGQVQITSPNYLSLFLDSVDGLKQFVILKHWFRDCIYQEYEAFKTEQPERYVGCLDQVDSYRNSGFPEHAGLFATTSILRSIKDKNVKLLDENWYMEESRWVLFSGKSSDQISLAYTVYSLDFYDKMAYVNESDWRSSMQLVAHNR